MENRIYIFLLILTIAFSARAQEVVSVSGIVMESEELVSIPFVNIHVKGTGYGTSSSTNGFFSIVVRKTDTLIFSSVGYRQQQVVIPDSLDRARWSTIVAMKRDTVMLDETVVYPWPSPRTFKQEFLALEVEKPKIQMGYMPGGVIKKLDTIVPVKPNPIMNPASFIYENVVLEMIKRMPKRKKVNQLPKFE